MGGGGARETAGGMDRAAPAAGSVDDLRWVRPGSSGGPRSGGTTGAGPADPGRRDAPSGPSRAAGLSAVRSEAGAAGLAGPVRPRDPAAGPERGVAVRRAADQARGRVLRPALGSGQGDPSGPPGGDAGTAGPVGPGGDRDGRVRHPQGRAVRDGRPSSRRASACSGWAAGAAGRTSGPSSSCWARRDAGA